VKVSNKPFLPSAVPVLGVSIAVPLALQPGRDSVLSCTVSAAGGGLQVRSAAAAAPHLGQLHLTAHTGQSLLGCLQLMSCGLVHLYSVWAWPTVGGNDIPDSQLCSAPLALY
jgi:hypothetical protein